MGQRFRLYYFLVSIVGGIFATAMPLYYEAQGFNATQVGILIAIPSAVMLIQPLWGILVDKYQKPKEIAMVSLFISSLLLLLMYVVEGYTGILIVVILFSIFKGPVWSTIDNIIITYCMNHNLKYGTLRVFASIAWGSSLLIMLPFSIIFGFKIYFLINFIISLILIVIIKGMPNNLRLDAEEETHNSFGQDLKILFSNKRFYYLIFFTLFFSAIFVTNLNYQAIYFEELGKSKIFIAVAMFVAIVPEFLILPRIERYEKNTTPANWLLLVCVIYIVKFLGMALTHNITLLLLLAALHGVAISFYIPTFVKLLKASVPSSVSTTALTINGFIAAISGVSMSLVAGVMREYVAIEYVFILNCIVLMLAIVILLFYKRNVEKKEEVQI